MLSSPTPGSSRSPRRSRALLGAALFAVLALVSSSGSTVSAQEYPIIEYRIEVNRPQLSLPWGTGIVIKVYDPPGANGPYLEYDLNPYYWENEQGTHDTRWRFDPLQETIDGNTQFYALRIWCINCIVGEEQVYRYRVRGPVGDILEFHLTVYVRGDPAGTPCTSWRNCEHEACVDGVCCMSDCGSGTQASVSSVGGSAAPCMACAANRGAVADGLCTLLDSDDRCENGSCEVMPDDGSVRKAMCACAEGFSGPSCDVDEDECATDHGGCDPLVTCTDRPGAPPLCGPCPFGYMGSGATACTDIDECARPVSVCDPRTTCTNRIGAVPICGPCPEGSVGTGESGCDTVPVVEPNDPDAGVADPDAGAVDPGLMDASVDSSDAGMDSDAGVGSDAGETPEPPTSGAGSGGCSVTSRPTRAGPFVGLALGLVLILVRRARRRRGVRARGSLAAWAGILVVLAACSDEPNPSTSDSGPRDAGLVPAKDADTTDHEDASQTTDAGESGDASQGTDAGAPDAASQLLDAGGELDASSPEDAGPASTRCRSLLLCGENAGCVLVSGVPTCVCDEGTQDVDGDGHCRPDCDGFDCSGHGVCSTSSGWATCACAGGYAGPDCAACAPGQQDHDGDGVCAPACGPGSCGGHGACDDASGTTSCTCDADYVLVAATGVCAPTCDALSCGANATCLGGVGPGSCTCNAGTSDPDGDGDCSPSCLISGTQSYFHTRVGRSLFQSAWAFDGNLSGPGVAMTHLDRYLGLQGITDPRPAVAYSITSITIADHESFSWQILAADGVGGWIGIDAHYAEELPNGGTARFAIANPRTTTGLRLEVINDGNGYLYVQELQFHWCE